MKIKKLLSKGILGCFNALAMSLVIQTANAACIWLIYQPKFPEEATFNSESDEEFRKWSSLKNVPRPLRLNYGWLTYVYSKSSGKSYCIKGDIGKKLTATLLLDYIIGKNYFSSYK